ncbi:AEC family transporter [Pleurocapsales cyanobacterium LEGE 06147]|nr:AEC family transporter [Pleurocapsales cyanobacterium LEGE 06147]
MNVIIPAIAPVGLIILIGFIAGRTLSLQHQTLSQLTFYILSSALVVDSLYRTTLSVQSTTGLLVGFALSSVFLYLVAWGIGKLFVQSPELQKGLLATSIFSNNGNMGLPVTAFAFGPPGLERAIVYMIVSAAFMFCLGPALLKGKGFTYGIRLTLKLPLLWSILVGLSLRILSIRLPFKLDAGIQSLGEAAIPVALILLGIQLASTRFGVGIKEILASGIRLLVAPLITFVVGRTLHLESLDLQVLVLQSAMPVAVNSLVLVTEFGGDAAFVARTILTSTLISFVSLPFTIWLLSVAIA